MNIKEELGDGYVETKPVVLETELILEFDEVSDIQPEIKLEPDKKFIMQAASAEQDIPVNKILRINNAAKKRTLVNSTNNDFPAKNTQEFDESSSNETSHVSRSSSKKPKYYQTKESLRENYIILEKAKMKLLEDHVKNELWFKDEDYHFLMSLQPQMKIFSSVQKLRIRQKLTQVLIDETNSLLK